MKPKTSRVFLKKFIIVLQLERQVELFSREKLRFISNHIEIQNGKFFNYSWNSSTWQTNKSQFYDHFWQNCWITYFFWISQKIFFLQTKLLEKRAFYEYIEGMNLNSKKHNTFDLRHPIYGQVEDTPCISRSSWFRFSNSETRLTFLEKCR